MKIALIDNNDSFTYNVVSLIEKASNNKPVIFKAKQLNLKNLVDFSHIIFSPGPGLPSDFPIMKQIIDMYGKHKNILGICLGHQAIAEYFGAELKNLNRVIHGQNKKITIVESSSIFKNLPVNIVVGLYHSWVVDTNNFPEELKITSFSEDQLIMSFEHAKFSIFGLQFHPESFMTKYGEKIMFNFLSL